MKMHFLTVAAAALVAAPMLHAQATAVTPATPMTATTHARVQRGHGRMMADLGLTADQKARMKAIHAKYAAQMKSSRAAYKPDFDAMKAARASHDTAAMRATRTKLRAEMAPSQKARQQEMTEMRSVLTPAQQQKFDAQRAQMKAKMANGRKAGHGAWKGKRAKGADKPVQPAASNR